MGSITLADLAQFLLFFPVLIIAITIHEFAHCWTDDRLGDDTPRLAGRVTLNPLKHLDPMGTIMMVVSSLSGFGFGWGKPAPFNPYNFRHPARDRMIGALAGPFSNILQMLAWASLDVLLVAIFPQVGESLFVKMCGFGVTINACLAVFNLLPVYPLDGHHILSFFAPRSWRPIIDHQAWGLVFLALVLFQPLRDNVLYPIISPPIEALIKGASFLTGW